MGTGKQYDEEFKKQAVKLAKEVGNRATAFTFEQKPKKGQKEYQEKAWVRERL